MLKWTGKVAVVTGASSGIGAAIAVELAKQNMVVVGMARRKEKVEALAATVKGPGKIHAVQCDVTDSTSIANAFDWVERNLGGVDVLINNAGTIRNAQLTDLSKSDELYSTQINTNFTGLVMCTRRALKSMNEREFGYIININSVGGHFTPNDAFVNMGINIYGATKWAVTNLTEVLRMEMRNAGGKVRVTSLSPAGVRTELGDVGGIDPELMKHIPFMESTDISDAVVYLLSTKLEVNVSELTIHPSKNRTLSNAD